MPPFVDHSIDTSVSGLMDFIPANKIDIQVFQVMEYQKQPTKNLSAK
jgi:hypothetical protein